MPFEPPTFNQPPLPPENPNDPEKNPKPDSSPEMNNDTEDETENPHQDLHDEMDEIPIEDGDLEPIDVELIKIDEEIEELLGSRFDKADEQVLEEVNQLIEEPTQVILGIHDETQPDVSLAPTQDVENPRVIPLGTSKLFS